MRRMWAVLVVRLLALPARAPGVHAALDAAFHDWFGRCGTTGLFASGLRNDCGPWDVWRQARVNAPPTGEQARVGKSVTALCVLTLVENKWLFWSVPSALPHASLGEGASSGIGKVFRPFRDGCNFRHFGALSFDGRVDTRSYAVLWKGQTRALARWSACMDRSEMAQLDADMSGAVSV